MSAEILRRAAALMRERAEATVSVFSATGEEVPWHSEASLEDSWDEEDAAHIASMSPVVALAVADWLDSEFDHQFGPTEHAINVARAYLQEEA